MNRLWAVGIFLVIIAALAATETYYTLDTAKTVENHIDKAIEAYHQEDKAESYKWLKKAKDGWSEKSNTLHIFLYHDNIHSIQVTMLTAEQMLEQNIDDFTAECVKAKEQLHFLQETQLPSIENIL